MNQAFQLLGRHRCAKSWSNSASALEHSGLKMGVRKVYASTFERLRGLGEQAKVAAAEIQAMLGATFKDLNAEFGFSLQLPADLQLHDFDRELANIEESYLQYLGFGHALKLANPLFWTTHGQGLGHAAACGV